MISLERSLPVNEPGSSPISRAEVLNGLVLPFVPSMTYCKVVERESATSFVREIEFKGDRMKERVTLEPEKTVAFERLSGPVLQDGATTLLEAKVTYFRKDSKVVTVPCVSILQTRGGKVADLRVHIESSRERRQR